MSTHRHKLSESRDKLFSIIKHKISSVGCEVSDMTIYSLMESLDLTKQYIVNVVTNTEFMKKEFNSGYRHIKTESEDYIERYVAYTLYGKSVPGYVKSGRKISNGLLVNELTVGVKVITSFGYSKDRGFINSDRCCLIIYKGASTDEII